MAELEEIIRKCIKRDARAEYALYRMYFNCLMRICWRYTKSEDDAASLLNKGFLKILNSLEVYKPDQPFESWIKTIMVNTIIDEFRAAKKMKALFVVSAPEDLVDSASVSNDAEQKMNIDEIVAQVKQLPEPAMHIFNLFVFDSLTHKEIGQKLNIPESTSRWHMANARAMLQKQLRGAYRILKTMVV
jgi:RNA polymerase sigma-70 factor (ECF subfamily)